MRQKIFLLFIMSVSSVGFAGLTSSVLAQNSQQELLEKAVLTNLERMRENPDLLPLIEPNTTLGEAEFIDFEVPAKPLPVPGFVRLYSYGFRFVVPENLGRTRFVWMVAPFNFSQWGMFSMDEKIPSPGFTHWNPVPVPEAGFRNAKPGERVMFQELYPVSHAFDGQGNVDNVIFQPGKEYAVIWISSEASVERARTISLSVNLFSEAFSIQHMMFNRASKNATDD